MLFAVFHPARVVRKTKTQRGGGAAPRRKVRGNRTRRRRVRRKVEGEQIAFAGHAQLAAFRIEHDGVARNFAPDFKHDVRGRDGRVAAQIDFDGRGEPAQPVAAVSGRNVERGFGEVIFAGDGLHGRVVQPAVERAYRGRVAGEQTAGESVELINGNAHNTNVSCAGGAPHHITVTHGSRCASVILEG